MRKCYMCGATSNLTKDHIPPKGFFSEPYPKNLITAYCCKTCHESFSEMDNEVRNWMALVKSDSKHRMGVLPKVTRDLFQTHPQLREKFLSSVQLREFSIRGQKSTELVSSMPRDFADDFVIRITKGFLSKFHPHYNYQKDRFSVYYLDPSLDQVETWNSLWVHCKQQSKEDAFTFGHALTVDGIGGCWIYIFYKTLYFMVIHDHDEASADEEIER